MTIESPATAYFSAHAPKLANQMVEGVLQRLGLMGSEEEKQRAILMFIDLFKFLGESDEGVPEHLLPWSIQNAHQLAVSGGKLSDFILRYPVTKEVFIRLMTNIGNEVGMSLNEYSTTILRFNSLFDASQNATVLAFERVSEQYRENTERELVELSAPLVLVQDGVAVVPLIGIVDSYRASQIAEHVLPKIAQQRLRYVIADYSGIPDMDESTAHYLKSLGSALSLMGVEVVTSGIRPELAMIIVQSGGRSDTKTFAHVKQALEWIDYQKKIHP